MNAKRRIAGAGERGHNLNRFLALLFMAIVLLSIVPTASADWHYRKPIEIDHNKIAADLTDFPVLINLASDSGLAAHAQNNGDDIVFTDGTNSTRLDHEIEKFDGSTGELQAWVRIPSLSSSTNTTILMWYGNSECGPQENATGVWDANYKMVQHLEETSKTDGTYNDHLDSTSNNNDGEVTGATMGATGKIDGADDLDGSDDYVKVLDSDSLNIGSTEITLSAWVKWDIVPSTGNSWANIINRYGDNNWGLQHSSGNSHFEFFVDTASGRYTRTSTTSPIQGSWYYIVGVYDGGSNMAIYVHGVSEHSGSVGGNIDTSDSDVYIGVNNDKERDFNGTIDEVRISATARSGDWISTTYNNTHSPSTFYDVKDEQDCYPAQPVPDLPAIILFSVGLLVLAGYVMLRSRNRE